MCYSLFFGKDKVTKARQEDAAPTVTDRSAPVAAKVESTTEAGSKQPSPAPTKERVTEDEVPA